MTSRPDTPETKQSESHSQAADQSEARRHFDQGASRLAREDHLGKGEGSSEMEMLEEATGIRRKHSHVVGDLPDEIVEAIKGAEYGVAPEKEKPTG